MTQPNNLIDFELYHNNIDFIKKSIDNIQHELNIISESTNKTISNIEIFQFQNSLLKKSYKFIIILRLTLNIIFDYLWSIYEIHNTDDDLFMKTYFEKPLLVPKKYLLEHNCYKFVFASLYLISAPTTIKQADTPEFATFPSPSPFKQMSLPFPIISHNLCHLFVFLNNKYEIRLKKESLNIIIDAIKELKIIATTNNMPQIYLDHNLNIDVINEIECLIDSYKFLF